MAETNEVAKKKHFRINKYVLNILFVLAIAGLSFYLLLKDSYREVLNSFAQSDGKFILYMILAMVGSYVIEGIILLAFARLYTTKYHLYQAICNTMIGTFYNSITPSASGGQFVQAHTFKKQGVDMASAASILVMHFIVSQIVLVLLGAIALISRYAQFVSEIGTIIIFDVSFNAITLSIIGFLINLLVIAGLLVMSYSKKLHSFILNTGVNIGARLKLVRNPAKTRSNLQIQVENFRIELRRLQSNIPFTILVLIFMIIRFVIYYSMPYLAGKALRAEINGSYFDSIAMASYLHMVTGIIPLPGGSGGAEYFFEKLFDNFYGSVPITHAANILWRSVTFYFGLIIGGFVSALYRTTPKQVGSDTGEFQTFVDLQVSTYEERKLSSDTTYATKQLSRRDIEERLKNFGSSLLGRKNKKNKNDEESKDESNKSDRGEEK